MIIEPIAYYHSPFRSKFGIPKQSGLVKELEGKIVFTPEYRDCDYIRGIEDFDYLWLIWEFSANRHASNSPVVRPPLLGGNTRIGVFATRSPYRPNPIGLSSVRLTGIETTADRGTVLHVRGGDLMDGTPIYDIKPYIEYADSHTNVRCGFVDETAMQRMNVVMPDDLACNLDKETTRLLEEILSLDPRPHYHNDDERIYGMPFYGLDIRFKVSGNTVYVIEILKDKR